MSPDGIKRGAVDDAFFRGKALLLVEDELTRQVLTTCWRDDAVGRLITVQPAGGRGGVEALLQAAREEKRANVFGLVDRDFDRAHAESRMPGKRRTTPGHEIENALLDFPVLAWLCAQSEQEVASRARAIAEQLIPWMALRRVVRTIKLALPGTPKDPKPEEVASDTAALAWLKQANYPGALERAVCTNYTAPQVQKLLEEELVRTRRTWEAGDWVTDFSGKEIVARLRSPAAGLAWKPAVAASDEALARAVAQRWRKELAIPVWITALRDDIHRACPPPP